MLLYGMKIHHQIKQKWADLLLGEFTPHTIAFGLSIGTLCALLPTFGFSAILAMILSFIFPGINRPAIFAALIIWNPVVQIPIYTLSYQLGSIMFADLPVVRYDIELLNQMYHLTRRFLVAHLVITVSISVLTYFSSRYYLNLKLK